MDHFGEHMELLRLSKFKLQLGTLISEFRELREREHSATEHLHHRIQKQKQNEEDFARKIQELQAELSSSNEHRQKLERKVIYLQNDNVLLENKQKELKETIHNLIQSKECFANAYEESNCDMKRAIQTRDRKLGVLSEKVKSHLLLFDSIEKEAVSVKQAVDNVQHTMSEKEDVVADLNNKLDKVSAFEKVFVEKIGDLEEKLKCDEDEIQRKTIVILELEAQVQAAKISTAFQTQIDELQKILSSKDAVIENLILEKEALHSELRSLGIVMKNIQDNLINMNEGDKDRFASILEYQEGNNMALTKDNRIKNVNQNSTGRCSSKAYRIGDAACTDSSLSPKSVGIHLLENNNVDSCVSEATSSEPQSAINAPCISANDENVWDNAFLSHLGYLNSFSLKKFFKDLCDYFFDLVSEDNHTTSIHAPNTESSTTQEEASKVPGVWRLQNHVGKDLGRFGKITFLAEKRLWLRPLSFPGRGLGDRGQ
ncbi:uncharacterized protein LOC133823161 [Humulus lupulus]|uniref:uncharacterized protein LOC133823161 n=1 Tax=Humulus lupulus TaxID=3486 RepID=UPI002B410C79|nr:uncharacterized protein LOC133823161 [Humulus lupulus]